MPTHCMMRRGRARWRLPARLLLAWLAALCWAAAAHAHSALLSAEPADGAVLDRAPAQAVLHFNEPVSPLVFRLVRPDGSVATLDTAQADGASVRIALPPQDGRGNYGLSWRVVSLDGHPVGGTLAYSVGSGTPPATAAAPGHATDPAGDGTGTGLAVLILLGRLVLYAALFFGAASRAFAAWTGGGAGADGAARSPWIAPLLLAGACAVPLDLALQGLDLLAGSAADLLYAAPWRAALATRYAATLALALLALAMAALAGCLRAPRRSTAAALAAPLLAALAFAASGHASTAPPTWLARPLVLLHTLAVALWLGALIPLHRAARQARAPSGTSPDCTAGASALALDAILPAFSRRIRPVVAVLIASGLVLAWLQLDSLPQLWRSAYGRVLMAKLTAVALLLALAAWNRWRLTAPAQRGEAGAARALRRVVAVEIAVAAVVLGIVSLWRFTPPPRAMAEQAEAMAAMPGMAMHGGMAGHGMPSHGMPSPAQPAAPRQPGSPAHTDHAGPPPASTPTLRLHADGLDIRLDYLPADAAGPAALRLALRGPDGRVPAPVGVQLTLSRPEQGIEPIRIDARPEGGGTWLAAPLRLPPLPAWHVRVDVLVDDFDARTLEGELPLPPAHP